MHHRRTDRHDDPNAGFVYIKAGGSPTESTSVCEWEAVRMCQCVSPHFGEALAEENENEGLNWRHKRAEWSLTASLANPLFICPSVWSCRGWWRDESYIHTQGTHTHTDMLTYGYTTNKNIHCIWSSLKSEWV